MNNKVHVKVGDSVVLRVGSYNDKYTDDKRTPRVGKVLEVSPKEDKVIVEGINFVTKHVKPRKMGEQGGIVKVESPIHISKVNYYCDKCGKGVKLGVQVKDSKKIRVCRKCNTEIK